MGMVTLFLCGDVMPGRGIDQILAHPGDPVIQARGLDDSDVNHAFQGDQGFEGRGPLFGGCLEQRRQGLGTKVDLTEADALTLQW